MSDSKLDVRYYVGSLDDLEGLNFFEVEDATYTFEWEAIDAFAESVDDVYGAVEVAGLTFNASKVIKKCDPIAWDCMVSDAIIDVDMSDYDDTGEDDA